MMSRRFENVMATRLKSSLSFKIPGANTEKTREESMNKLYSGDSLDILWTKIKNETVELCYIDRLFNSKRNHKQIYNDLAKYG